MTMHQPVHSPLGASAAERWMNCPGSNVLLDTLDLPPSEETDYAKEGVAAHELSAVCLRDGSEPWMYAETDWMGYKVDGEMVDALGIYLMTLAEVRASHRLVIKELIEYRISGDFHPLFYGTVDSAIIGEDIIDITDLKYGAGIAVDVEKNPQLMYYAVGILSKFMGPTKVRLRIVQPRAFHINGPVRVWETTSTELLQWRDEVLIPAMSRAEIDVTLAPGDWCRFCPAKLACPLLTSLFGASIAADATVVPNFSNEGLARNYALVDAVKHYLKALEAEVYRRMSHGEKVPGYKLVPKKANRVFTPEALTLLPQKFSDDDIYEKKLKTPAQLEKLGNTGKQFVREFAYTPMTGLTVAGEDDSRAGVKMETVEQKFAHIAGLQIGES